jgi:hypothetical protein
MPQFPQGLFVSPFSPLHTLVIFISRTTMQTSLPPPTDTGYFVSMPTETNDHPGGHIQLVKKTWIKREEKLYWQCPTWSQPGLTSLWMNWPVPNRGN